MPEQIDTSSTSDGQTSKFPEKRWSLLVGVNSAPESDKPQLEHAENDVRQMAQILRDHCGFEPFREPLLGTMATSGNVMKAIGRFISERKDDEFLLFYFSGHGIACRLDEATDDDDIYLVTSDFSSLDINVNPAMHLSLKLLRKMLYEQCYAGKVLIILDCCYAGNISGHGPDLDREELVRRLARYLDINVSTASNTKGLRLALAATAYNKAAYVVDGHGPLARWLIPALSGEANDAIDSRGRITFNSLRDYLQDQMSEYPPSASGGDAGRNCILAYHSKHPNSHFPYGHDPLFRPRESEFEQLEAILRTKGDAPVRLGLTGMGGVGKSLLARELVLRTREYFTDGVFWATATVEGQPETGFATKDNPLIHALAELAMQTSYLPPGDDPAYPNEELRARYFCRFVAQHPHALLILDNLDDSNLITTKLAELASMEPQCAVLYTSREAFAPSGIRTHQITPLNKVQDLLHVLLYNVPGKEYVLALEGTNETSRELEAAHSICKRVGGLPLALVLLRSQLETNSWLTLAELDQELQQYGVLAVAQDEFMIKTSLRATFELSWRKVHDEHARQMFQLASYFPEAISIPLWLLALVCEMREEYGLNSDLTRTRRLLTSLSLVEDVSRHEIQMHPLLREFGQKLVKENNEQGQVLLQAAGEHIVTAFEDVQRLEERARSVGYWNCLSQVRIARTYVSTLQPDIENRLKKVERRLDRETFFLATSGLWPDKIPGLFYQQMYNRMLEEEQPLPSSPSPGQPWLRQLERVDTKDGRLLRVFSGHNGGVNSVAFSPDSSKVLTGSEDATARIFDTASGKTLLILKGHTDVIDSVAYSPDGTCVLTGARDRTARLWSTENGECIRVLQGHTDWINGVTFSPDATLVLTGSQDGSACIWQRDTGVLQLAFPLDKEQFPDQPMQAKLWNEDTIDQFTPPAVTCVAFSPDNTYVSLGLINGSFTLWNINNNTLRSTRLSNSAATSSIAFSPNGIIVFVGLEDGTLCLCSKDQDEPIGEWSIHNDKVTSIAFSHDPNGTYILTGSWDGNAILWKMDKELMIIINAFVEQAGTINSVAFSHDDLFILLGSSDAMARTWVSHIIPSIVKNEAPTYKPDDNPYTRPYPSHLICAAFSPDSSQLLGAYHSENPLCKVSLWDVEDRKEIQNFPMPISWVVNVMSFNGKKIVLGYLEGQAQIREREMESYSCLLEGHTGSISSSYISPDNRYILTGSSDTTARLWDATTGRTIKILKGHVGSVISVALSSDGTRLLTGSQDHTGRLWKREQGKYTPIVLRGHDAVVTSVAFSPDGKKAFTGYADGVLCIWNSEDGILQTRLDGQIGAISLIACAPDSGSILTGHLLNHVRLWGLDEQGTYHLQGAFATYRALKAAQWRSSRELLLVDDGWAEYTTYIFPRIFPRIYKLRLED